MTYALKRSIGFKINQTANRLNNRYNQILQDYEIAPEQRATLEIIKYEQTINQTKIADMLGKDKTTISRTLKTLENKGFIFKTQIDKRTNIVRLTEKGENILEDSSECVKDFRTTLHSNLNKDEIKIFEKLLEKVVLGLKD